MLSTTPDIALLSLSPRITNSPAMLSQVTLSASPSQSAPPNMSIWLIIAFMALSSKNILFPLALWYWPSETTVLLLLYYVTIVDYTHMQVKITYLPVNLLHFRICFSSPRNQHPVAVLSLNVVISAAGGRYAA